MSLSDEAARALKEWHPPEGEREQEQLRQRYLDHLLAHPDGVWKSCREGHLTASALIVDPERARVLLTLHRKLRMWLQMGGHCEPEDGSLESVALREASEESGVAGLRLLPGGPVRLDRHHTPCAWHLDVQYAAVAPPDAEAAVSEESLDVRWYGFEEVSAVADASVVRLLESTRARL